MGRAPVLQKARKVFHPAAVSAQGRLHHAGQKSGVDGGGTGHARPQRAGAVRVRPIGGKDGDRIRHQRRGTGGDGVGGAEIRGVHLIVVTEHIERTARGHGQPARGQLPAVDHADRAQVAARQRAGVHHINAGHIREEARAEERGAQAVVGLAPGREIPDIEINRPDRFVLTIVLETVGRRDKRIQLAGRNRGRKAVELPAGGIDPGVGHHQQQVTLVVIPEIGEGQVGVAAGRWRLDDFPDGFGGVGGSNRQRQGVHGRNLFNQIRINHSARWRAARIERMPLIEDGGHGGDPGYKRQKEGVRLDIERFIGMHMASDLERLAATDFHVARGIQGKLENRDGGQLHLLQHAGDDVLHAGRFPGVGHHRVSCDIALQAGIRRIEGDIVARTLELQVSPVRIAGRVVEFPVAPVGGVGRGGNRVHAIGAEIGRDQAFTAIQIVPRHPAQHFFGGRFRRRHGTVVLDGTVRQAGAAGRPAHRPGQNRERHGGQAHRQQQCADGPVRMVRGKSGFHIQGTTRGFTEVSSL